MAPARICIVSPALAEANSGNWHTASRWQRHLSTMAQVDITTAWQGHPVDVLIALHARRSAASVAAYATRYPHRPLVVVLTGTDLYRDLPAGDADAARSLRLATALVVLQEEAPRALPAEVWAKAHVIVQSAPRYIRRDKATRSVDVVAVGHLRTEKDPLTLMQAVRLLPASSPKPKATVKSKEIGAAWTVPALLTRTNMRHPKRMYFIRTSNLEYRL